VTERSASQEAEQNHASEMNKSNAACKEDFGGPKKLNKEN
jgi:hypothetical protein